MGSTSCDKPDYATSFFFRNTTHFECWFGLPRGRISLSSVGDGSPGAGAEELGRVGCDR
jgi:hypothetical protein